MILSSATSVLSNPQGHWSQSVDKASYNTTSVLV